MKSIFQAILDFIKLLFSNMQNTPEITPKIDDTATQNEPTPDTPTPTPNSSPDAVPPRTQRIDDWCAAIKIMEGALPRRNNPGNLRFIGQKYAVNDGGFCKFDTYAHGYQALRNLLVNACSGKSSVYHPTDTLYVFYTKYAPSTDGNDPKHYAEFVASKLEVSPTIQIENLL